MSTIFELIEELWAKRDTDDRIGNQYVSVDRKLLIKILGLANVETSVAWKAKHSNVNIWEVNPKVFGDETK